MYYTNLPKQWLSLDGEINDEVHFVLKGFWHFLIAPIS